jgi:hypothetical protein
MRNRVASNERRERSMVNGQWSMANSRWLLVILISLISHLISFGQAGTNDEMIVIKQYKSTLEDADKITVAPSIPDEEVAKQNYVYQLPQKDYKSSLFEPNPLKPIALSKEKIERRNGSYIKFGFGTQLTPLAQLAYNDNRTKNLKFGLWYDHLSMRGFQNKFMRFSDDKVGVYLKGTPGKIETGFDFSFHNLRTHFYATDSVEKRQDIFQRFRSYDGRVFIKNTGENKLKLNFKQDVSFSYFQEFRGAANEWFVGGNTYAERAFGKKHHVDFDFTFDISKYTADTLALQRNIFKVRAGYFFDNDDWLIRGKGGVAVDGKKVYPLAHVTIEKRLYQHYLIVLADWQFQFNKNSFRDFALNNNFVNSSLQLQNTRRSDLQVALKGTAKAFSYNAGFHYKRVWNMAMFVNDTNNMNRFDILYDHANVYTIHAEMGYNWKENLRSLLAVDYHIFDMDNELKAWHEPALNLSFRTTYNFKEKMIFGLELFALAQAHAKLANGSAQLIKGTADLNVSAEYVFKKYLSFFINLNNIAHQKYQRFYRYPSFGFNGVIGAKFSF